MREFQIQLLQVLANGANATEFIKNYIDITSVTGVQVKNWLHEMHREGYINLSEHDLYKLATNEVDEADFKMSITSKGHNKLTELNKKEVPSINIVGDITNSQIGIHSDFLSNDLKKVDINEDSSINNINLPVVNFIGWSRKFINWVKKHILELIIGVIASVISYFITKGK